MRYYPNFRTIFGVLVLTCGTFCDLGNNELDETTDMYGVTGRAMKNIDGQIIGGQEAESGQFPWQVMLRWNAEFQCGGSLISDRWVLTAAHCVADEGEYSVRLGILYMDGFEENGVHMDIPAQNIIIHEENDILDDIALIKLPLAIVLPKKRTDNFYINAIRLPKRSEVKQTQEGKLATVSGWGRIDPDDQDLMSDVLKSVSLPVISNAACGEGFGDIVPTSIICLDTKMQNGTCNGDSGGPLVILGKDKKYTLYGVTSYVAGTTCLEGPDAFVRVSSYLNWIKKITKLPV